jgi:hypothetical protein
MALDCANNVIDHFSGRLAPERVINRSVLGPTQKHKIAEA